MTNATSGDITGLEVRFSGGTKSFQRLMPSDSFKTVVNPRGESDLMIQFIDSRGTQHSAKVDVYLERGYRGTIHVVIQPDGTVTWKDGIKVGVEYLPP